MRPIPPETGLLAHLVGKVRPDLAAKIADTGRIETAVVGLGGQGTRHAGLMQRFGTLVVGGVAPGRGGERVVETIPVYESVADLLGEHPDLAAVSIWRHFSSARDAALECIAAGVPVIVLITEGIPLRDVRDVLAAAEAKGTLLLGGNTPGAIFPPERIKIGMLPDVFQPAEPEPDVAGPRGVTIVSRSGAILYHMSDALASAGIALSGVIGVGGDGAIGAPFRVVVPLAMEHEATDLVVIAGEIGGAQEEIFAEDVAAHPERYPKPIVALISGRRAPAGKTMGHAGAIVAPGQEYGTYASKREALEGAGVVVVNNQYDLIEAVREKLGGKTYFQPARYYDRMREHWEAAPEPPTWGTRITAVAPNELVVAGYALPEIVRSLGLVETTHLLVALDRPSAEVLSEETGAAIAAAADPAPTATVHEGEQLSTTLARFFLLDGAPTEASAVLRGGRERMTVRAVGRTTRFLARALGNEAALDAAPSGGAFGERIARAVGAGEAPATDRVRLIEALAVASVDHGVTPPSAQATVIAATVRAPVEMALASGLGAVTDVHGGAGADAATFFLQCVSAAKSEGTDVEEAAYRLLDARARAGLRIAGLGHRVHTEDPRRDVLWELAEASGAAGPCVALSKILSDVFADVRGFRLPINVDGVIGAVVADLGLPPIAAKALFVLGRTAGLAAHYFEEVRTQPPMRRVRFEEAVYRGPAARSLG